MPPPQGLRESPRRIPSGTEPPFHWIRRKLEILIPQRTTSLLTTQQDEASAAKHSLSPRFMENLDCFECIVQDNDPRVLYEGQWSLNQEKFFTTHSTKTSGSTASLTFNGTGITVFGTVPASNTTVKPPTVAYRVNAAQPFTTTQPVADNDVSNQPLFSFTFGSQWKENKITIQVLQAETPFTLERFFVFPVNKTMADANDESPPQGSPPNSTTYNATEPTTGLTSNDAPTQRTVRILAGFLGITTFIAVVASVFLIFHYIRQRRLHLKRRPDTLYTHFTSTDTILRHNPPSGIWSSNLSRSDGMRSVSTRPVLDSFVEESEVPPVPPKAAAYYHNPNSKRASRVLSY